MAITAPNLNKEQPTRLLPEGCRFTKNINGSRVRVFHIVKYGNNPGGKMYQERPAWLLTDVICDDPERVCIQYRESNIIIDVPAIDVVIERIEEVF